MENTSIPKQDAVIEANSGDCSLYSAYFVTLCLQDRMLLFGEVVKGKMQLSEIGSYALRYWEEIAIRNPYITLDAFVVMPNHIHGILVINKQGNQKEIMSSIVGSYKAVVEKSAKEVFRKFAWQSKIHAQLIKDKTTHTTIADYIANNPSKWRHDKFYKS
ncbi:MAG: transposase [Bacteroidetes bacterium]|nr:transposase [Bacteroidota bacterium]HET6246044.1 transposase [Bacteroidia bacterium]